VRQLGHSLFLGSIAVATIPVPLGSLEPKLNNEMRRSRGPADPYYSTYSEDNNRTPSTYPKYLLSLKPRYRPYTSNLLDVEL
jgi:hypothetical protein